jgi:CubicO group peptidase (beta-lactamase class C family)/lysophospholipase L1-like esterase
MRTQLHSILFALACTMAASVAAAPGSPTALPDYWPTTSWRESSPEAQGMDSRELAKLFDFVREQRVPIHSLLIVRNGRVVVDASFFPYQAGMLHDLASGTKSVTSTLVGVAIERHALAGVSRPAWPILQAGNAMVSDARKSRITIEDLLTMQSGISCEWMHGETTLDEMRGSSDWVRFVLDRPMVAEPGREFAYCSPGMHLLSGIISKVTGSSTLDYARRELFTPLGIDASVWPSDPAGVSYGWGDLHLRPRDMAKLGLLWLADGVWDGKQIVPADWMTAAERAHVTHMGEGYGYGLWVYPDRQPPVFESNGRGGQRISVVPAVRLVAVMTGGGFEPGDIGKFIGQAIKSDRAIPENAAARIALDSAIAKAARPPSPHTPSPLPSTASEISGKQWALDANPLGLKAITFSFPSAAEGVLRVEFSDGRTEERPMGLDGVPRLSPGGRFGLPVAVTGEWRGKGKFAFEYDEIGNINCYQFSVAFDGNVASFDVHERTGLLDARLRGHQVSRTSAVAQRASGEPTRWIGTWGAAAQPAVPSSILSVRNQTLRLIAHTSVGGAKVRIRVSNTFGDRPLVIGSAHIANRTAASGIDPASDRSLTFDGRTTVSIPAGSIAASDPVDLKVQPLADLAVSLFLPNSTPATTSHILARQTSYVSNEGDFTAQTDFPVARTIRTWPFLTGIEVAGSLHGAAIVAFGSSTTDGDGSSLDANHRYPDALAERLQRADNGLRELGVLNEGIIGNRLLNDSPSELRAVFGGALGQPGVGRFERDVLWQPGAKYVILALGVNDILFPGSFTPAAEAVTPDDLIAGYRLLIARAHVRGIRVIGTTIPPFENATFTDPPARFYTPEKDAVRIKTNDWILGAKKEFDGVVDFDAALRDPTHPSRLLPAYDSGDHLHMNDAGYAASANAIPLELFRER